MIIQEMLKSAIKQLAGSKGRTLLTMLGMFIGIGSVIMILALGNGFTQATMKEFEKIGLGVFQISVKENFDENYITDEDYALVADMEEVEELAAGMVNAGRIYTNKGEQYDCSMLGVGPAYVNSIEKIDILAGRNLADKDEAAYARNIVIADSVAQALYKCGKNYNQVIGETMDITIDKQPNSFNIIGVYDTNVASNLSEKELEKYIGRATYYMPYRTIQQITGNEGKISIIVGKIGDAYDQEAVTNRIAQILNRRHHLKDGYSIQSFVQMLEMAKTMMNTITLFIGAVASISLIVGGVGIMNIMLVTVKERTREIGVRKALGAPNGVILEQFIIEALMLTLIAGIIGMLIGYVGAILVGAAIDIQAQFTLGMLLFSVLTSTAIGLIFGVYPAYQAARLDPIEALRAD